ncbi:hypothetical protein SMD11_0318 [Streptomyces albireticuli]|uniref:Uncharacterized protein n=1 Tax=Streptomyces albireticuli TaxID=1940 RepID=A0A1Z2KVA3_9ACTN|nr:hypothetical protein [Streptomyces albireticuli]ARZ65984.1 hypothetical protein SMD11_0318 [Streptomyces albireticuli]
MTTWGLVLETSEQIGERRQADARVLAHVEGTREEALAELERHARSYAPEYPRRPKRRRLIRHGDGFLLVIDCSSISFSVRFTVGELLADSAAPEPPVPYEEPEPADEVPAPPDERDDDGVPVTPAWLGRTDLP